ncbi:MAG: diguanylate cyclase [Thiohalomonadaceae bacterium]
MTFDKQARVLAVIFLLLGLAILTIGQVTYRQQVAHLKKVHLDDLQAVANLKVDAINGWLAERRANVISASGNPTIANTLADWQQSKSQDAKASLIGFLQNFRLAYNFSSAELIDVNGQRLLGVGDDVSHSPELLLIAKKAMDTGTAQMLDLHYHPEDKSIRLGYVSPIFIHNGYDRQSLGLVFVGMRADIYLYPYIQNWPRTSASGEFVMVRREGDEFLYLNALRHKPDAAFNLRQPISTASLPVAIDIQTGIQTIAMEGTDYRGVATLFAGRAVPDTPWYLIAKIDESEALAELKLIAMKTTGMVILALIFTLTILTMLWHRQRLQSIRAKAILAQELQASEERYRTVFKQAKLPSLLINPLDGRIITANNAAADYYGYTVDQLQQMKVTDINTLPAEFIAAEMALAYEENRNHFNFRHRLANGEIRDVEVYSGPLTIDGQNLLFATVLDVSERKRMEHDLIEMATIDALTGLPNRRYFLDRLKDQVNRMDRAVTPGASVMMLDLDHFKLVNDTYGHAAGDAVLRHVAKLMQENIRNIDIPGRLGGEEFAILLPGIQSSEAFKTAERLRQIIASTPTILGDGTSISLTISIGISDILREDSQADTPLSRADKALYHAKQTGRNRTVLVKDMNVAN